MTTASPPPSLDRRTRPSGISRLIVWTIVLAVIGVGIYLVFVRKPAAAQGGRRGGSGPVNILTATATKGDIGDYIKRIGNVVPVKTASIFSQVTGVVNDVPFTEGQTVNEGDPLVEIDPSQYKATLTQAEGTLERDQSILLKDETDLDRYEEAWKLNAVAKQILDDQRLLVEQDKGTVKIDQGVVDYDTIQEAYCHIKAPIAGRVGLRLVDKGNLITAGSATPLAVITQMQPITVVFSIPEGNDNLSAVLAQLKNNAKLTADVYDSTDTKKLASGEFLALDSQIDTTTGTVKVRAIFKNEDQALFPNQFVNVHLLVQTLTGVTLIPTATIQQNGQTSFVYVVKDNVTHVQNVKPGVADDKLGLTQVEGINPGDVVANSSFDKLQDGTKITIDTGKPGAGKGGASPGTSGTSSPAQSGTSSADESGASPSPHKHRRDSSSGGGDSGS